MDVASIPVSPKTEKPLSPAQRTRLIIGASLVALLFYGVVLFSLLLVLFFLVFDTGLLLLALRFGGAGYVVGGLVAQGALGYLILACLRRPTGPEWNIPLTPENAPGLFQMLEGIAARVNVAVPDRVELQMPNNAGVVLRGYRTGTGRCTLSVGYDLLAALTVPEVESVMAHELAHARLIQRGYSGLLSHAVMRMVALASTLESMAQSMRDDGSRFHTAELLQKIYGALAKLGVRLLATYQRQEEFMADAAAAAVTGSRVYQAALLHTHVAAYKGADLGWRERIIQMQRGGSFDEWLRARLSPDTPEEQEKLEQRALTEEERSEYDMHPVLADRLAALPAAKPGPIAGEGTSGLDLLRNSESLAAELVAHLDETAAKEEKRETPRIRKEVLGEVKSRAVGARALGSWVVGIGVTLWVLLFLVTLGGGGVSLNTVLFFAVLLAAILGFGWLLKWVDRPREKNPLPVPPFETWHTAFEERHPDPPPGTIPMPDVPRFGSPAFKQSLEQCYAALYHCNYPQAASAAEANLRIAAMGQVGLLTRAIAQSGAGKVDESLATMHRLLGDFQHGPSVTWGLAWLFLNLCDWKRAEGLLLEAMTFRPVEGRLWSYLAYAQWRGGRIHEATRSARKALELDPDESPVLLTRILLSAGRPRDAERELLARDGAGRDPYHAELCAIRCRFLLDRKEEGLAGAAEFAAKHPDGRGCVALAHCLEEAEVWDQARVQYERALESDFYPDALLALARIAAKEKEQRRAWDCLAMALNLNRAVPPGALGPLDILEAACDLTLTLQEPRPNLSVWIATVDLRGTAATIPSLKLAICAENDGMARDYVRWLYQCLLGAQLPVDGRVTLEELPAENRPTSPVAPGIHRVGSG